METTYPKEDVEVAVPQRYKDFVVRRQYRWFWIIVSIVTVGLNLVYCLLCLAFHWTWKLQFQGDIVLPLIGLATYAAEARKPWRYEINEKAIKLFAVNQHFQFANLKEVEWAKTEVFGVEQAEWQGLPALKLKVLPIKGLSHWLIYSPVDEEEVRAKVLPLIEKYRRSHRQELWADKLRS